MEQLSEKIAALYFFIFPPIFPITYFFLSIHTISPAILRSNIYEENRNHRTSQDI